MSSPPNPRPVLAAATAPGSALVPDRLQELRRFHLGLVDAPSQASQVVREYSPAALRALRETRPETRPGDELPGSANDGQAALLLFLQTARSLLAPARAAFRHEVSELATCGRAMLEGAGRQASENGRATTTEQALGSLGSRFIDPSSLSEMLDQSSDSAGRRSLPPTILERTLVDLEPSADEGRPEGVLIHSGHPMVHALGELEVASGHQAADPRIVEHEDPCIAAVEIFDREAETLARTLRAVRRLRLEISGEYRHELHDPWLEQLDWQGFSRHELHLLPQVVAILSADQAAGPGMASLSRLLLSGRPVQVFVLLSPLRDPRPDPSSFRFEPAYFGLSHREALVQQVSLARPAHMREGFSRALSATRAALHVLAAVASGCDNADAPADVMLEGRAHPLFRYDPEVGPGWAERCDISANPQPLEDWPVYQLTVQRPGGGEESLRLPVTLADLALLDPAYARHFAPVPEGVPDRQLVTVASYCTRSSTDEVSEIPYLWALDGSSRLCRLAVSRTLAVACRDRLGFWRTLQELGGIGSGYVQQAAREARQQAEEKAAEELARFRASCEAELDRASHQAAHEVVDRLTAALFEVDPATLAGPAGSPAESTTVPSSTVASGDSSFAAGSSQTAVEPPAVVEAEEEALSEGLDPYIDTELCTTCNECTDLNPQMFAYNDDKKAYIQDPRAGTFQQLVRAAELCTARIIHPGTPLDPAEEDLDQWVKRAEALD